MKSEQLHVFIVVLIRAILDIISSCMKRQVLKKYGCLPFLWETGSSAAYSGKFPFLYDKRYLVWYGSGENILHELQSWLGHKNPDAPDFSGSPELQIPIPKVKRLASDQEKESFLRESF